MWRATGTGDWCAKAFRGLMYSRLTAVEDEGGEGKRLKERLVVRRPRVCCVCTYFVILELNGASREW